MTVYLLQLDKVYNSSNPDDDMVEREEEMNRMREHVFNEIDKDKDQFVSMKEFLESTNSDDFDTDEEWDVCLLATSITQPFSSALRVACNMI